ncbi:MAG TPA: hypothetical protein DIU00_09820 [Phycisphaerales bacterium]|nr:hypothetical protein [Phycisphaerales bacterium]
MNDDKQNLKLLSIFHYVVGAMAALFSCFPLIHIAIGFAILSGAFDGKDAPPKFLGLFFIILPGIMMLCGWTLAVCILIAGGKLARYRARMYCLVIAGLECIFMPFGTVLGVFTIVVLMKNSVKELFETSRPFQQ